MTGCAECNGALSAGAKACSHCGHPVGPWGSCPECKAAITAEQAACKECGFPLKARNAASPSPAPPPPARAGKATTRTRKRRKARQTPAPGGEPPSAMIFAVLGLFVPVLAIVGLVQSKRGSGAYILSWIDIALWIGSVLFLFSRVH